MLTVDFARFPVRDGDRVLDLGCGAGRHTFEVARRGGDVVAIDMDAGELATVAAWLQAMRDAGEIPVDAPARTLQADALDLPFADDTFDVVIAAEILEHLPDDRAAMAEIARVVRPGGRVAVTVPRWLPELVCWGLSSGYHEVAGGHVRVYRESDLLERLRTVGLQVTTTHHAHALHTPFWWLKCAVGVDNEDARVVRGYHRLLVWDIERSPWITRVGERLLDPVIGKSLVVYLHKPDRDTGSKPGAVVGRVGA